MAQQMVCDGCNAEPAVMIIQNLDTPDVTALGVSCAPAWLRSIADAIDTPAPDATPDLAGDGDTPHDDGTHDPDQSGDPADGAMVDDGGSPTDPLDEPIDLVPTVAGRESR